LFKGKKFKLFDGLDPNDIIMGSCNNCYLLAALSGMAESTGDDEINFSSRIFNKFLTQDKNKAGCYAISFIIDGEPREIVVDDYFPTKKMKTKVKIKDPVTGEDKIEMRNGREIFAFTKNKIGENEIWVQLIEKAWAKLCGSFEASEMGHCREFFENFDGTPCFNYWIEDYETTD
jgi:hypothetical protein